MPENKNEDGFMARFAAKFVQQQWFFKILCIILAFSFGAIHYNYVAMLFENDRNFSHLSELEREMSFRTEMGFYYSYYKTIVEEKQLLAGISKIMYDNLVEYPKEVNAFNRFNIHPEVILGTMYRYLEPYLNSTDPRVCHTISRGPDIDPVVSCLGLAEPIYFYLEAIWWLAGLTVSTLFLYAVTLSGSIAGGAVAVLQYFANHANCTRVQWTPNERENLASPLLLLQMWLVTSQLRQPPDRRGNLGLQITLLIVNALCLLFWQFAQFIFLTQTAIYFVMEQLRIIDQKTFCIFLHSHFCGLHIAVLLLQGNDMLKSSIYSSFFLVVSAYSLFFSSLRLRIRRRLDLILEMLLVAFRISVVIALSLWLRRVISDFLNVTDDSHIFDILYSKFTNFRTFHTMLYTCAPVFDFLPVSYVIKVTKTGVLPIVLAVCVNSLYRWYYDTIDACVDEDTSKRKSKRRKDRKRSEDKSEDSQEDDLLMVLRNLKIDPAIFYNVSQMVVFGMMTVLFMRLKLLFTPHMCLVSSLVVQHTYFTRGMKTMKMFAMFFIVVCVAVITYNAKENILRESSHVGQFSDYHQEQLLTYILGETSPTDSFAGPMPLMASVLLSTRRAVANTPHYEHADARARTYAIYKTYGRFSHTELYKELTKLKVTYLILEKSYCYGLSNRGCSFAEIWDHEAPHLKNEPLLCHRLLTEELEHFYPTFDNEMYTVFRIHDFSVRYTPRQYDT